MQCEGDCISPIAKRIVSPLQENDELAAKREAVLKPRVIREFLTRYNRSSIPRQDIAQNVLVDLGVPKERAAKVFELIMDSAQEVGFLTEIKGKSWVDLAGTAELSAQLPAVEDSDVDIHESTNLQNPSAPQESLKNPQARSELERRVFVTHGKNREFLDLIKQLLGFGEMTPVISVERSSVSKPVPDKVMDDMRGCGAAIIHVDVDETFLDKDDNEHVLINDNVLIEIGAAMALYGRRFILLVCDGIQLPSNLQGLFQVRYKGDKLDGDGTIKLLNAIKDMKNHELPARKAKSGDPNYTTA